VKAVSAATRVAAVLGDPIEHSLSPTLHNAGYEAAGLDWVYTALRVPRSAAAAAFAGVRALGLAGVNVTMPLKNDAFRLADRSVGDVAVLEAANTVVNESGVLVAHNTDVEGFIRAAADLGVTLSGIRAVVVGAGGAARAVVAGLHRAGAESVVVAGRRKSPTTAAAALAGGAGRPLPLASARAAKAVAAASLVVNATPLGMNGDPLPDAVVGALGPGHAVIDLVYAPPVTPLMESARATGARVGGGLGMLVHQAGLAFTLFTGQPAPLEAMSAAVVADISHRHTR